MNLYLDIETIGTTNPAVMERVTAGVKPPGNYKKAESIEKWWAEGGDAQKAEAIQKTAFDGAYGKIVCIGFALDDEPAVANCSSNESSLIRHFYTRIKEVSGGRDLNVVGHNVVGFDLKFLWQRSVVHGIRPPSCINFKVKPWESCDTMNMWSQERRISLDNLCAALSIPSPKGELDGSKVAEAFANNEVEKIEQYCRGDVEAVRQCYKRMTFQ